MTKIFTRVEKLILSALAFTVAGRVTYTFRIVTITTNNKNLNNDPAMAGSFSFLRIPIFHFNKNLFMETLRRDIGKSILALFLFLAAMFLAGKSMGQGSQPPYTAVGTSTFTVPPGVTSITVAVWGAGGAGGGITGGNPRSGGGGEGGAFVRGTLSVTPGTQYQVVVGGGGTASNGNGTAGASSSFGGSLFVATGGAGGAGSAANGTFGAGGASTNVGNFVSGTSQSNNYGGDGGGGSSNNTASSGGGGGSAGAGGNGGNGASVAAGQQTGGAGTAGAAGTPSAPGVAGALGRGSQQDGIGFNASSPGAGGGGARNGNNNTAYIGGTGGNGQVIITWTCPAATISYPPSICKSSSSVNVTVDGAPGGTFSSTAGLSLNTSTGEINPSTSNAGSYSVQYQIAGGGGCPAVNTSATIQINAAPVSSVVGQSDANCFAGSDGSINIGATGGTGPYFYSVDNGATWTPTAHASPYIYGGLSANTQYRIRIKDSNGCLSK